jgi:hypothetical protein
MNQSTVRRTRTYQATHQSESVTALCEVLDLLITASQQEGYRGDWTAQLNLLPSGSVHLTFKTYQVEEDDDRTNTSTGHQHLSGFGDDHSWVG